MEDLNNTKSATVMSGKPSLEKRLWIWGATLIAAVFLVCIIILAVNIIWYKLPSPPPPPGPPPPPPKIAFDGYVYDEETTRPIKGAQIVATWTGSKPGIMQLAWVTYGTATAETDANGYYSLPEPKPRKDLSNLQFKMWLYKAGYICYTPEGGFRNVYKSDFKQFQNIIYLKRWNPNDGSMTHGQHIRFMPLAEGSCIYLHDDPKRISDVIGFCTEVFDELRNVYNIK